MSLFDATTINRYANEGENDFCVDYPCIIKRLSLAAVTGTGGYVLPDEVLNIRSVLWKGWKLDPIPTRNWREVFQAGTQVGRPFWYLYNNIGQNTIQFFPAPNETISALQTNLYGSEIPNRVIVEYYMAPDFTTNIMPAYFRRRLLKAYVLRGCFNIEGQGQNMKLAKYYKDRYNFLKKMYGTLLGDLYNKPRKLVVNGISSSYYFPGRPILPIDRFGTSVDIGE